VATFELDDIDAEALRRIATNERRTVDELAVEAVRELVARRTGQAEEGDALTQELARAREDRELMATLGALVERDREILDRLAE
jgi:hypothetical protein